MNHQDRRTTGPDHARRRLREAVRLPKVSGWVSVLVLVICFGLTAVFVPLSLRLPLWIEFQVVLACWWLIWGLTLSRLAYRQAVVKDDWEEAANDARRWKSEPDASGCIDFPIVGDDLLGCLLGIVVVIGLVLVAWLLVELVLPLMAVCLYLMIRAMLVHALHRDHGCRGQVLRSLAWGWCWATAYTAPLALVVWLVHLIAKP